ncbi:hypothetical protein [Chroococcidiopsis sp. SAG 2025]|nr:hypothetical protein [Chroococcidiopsis sp. SAG 2025]
MENQRDIPISTSRDRGFTDYFKKILTKYLTYVRDCTGGFSPIAIRVR